MGKYFELTDETINHEGRMLHRIRATRNLPYHGVMKGDLGGYVEKMNNLSNNARVSGYADVFGDEVVSGDTWLNINA